MYSIELSPDEDEFARNEIKQYYRYPWREKDHDDLINDFFSNMIKEVFKETTPLDDFLSERTWEEQAILKKLIQVCQNKLTDENSTGYFGLSYDYCDNGDNWSYEDSIKDYFTYGEWLCAETLNELEQKVLDKNCLWFIVDDDLATKTRIKDAKLKKEKETAYDEANYTDSLEIHPRYARKFIKDYYKSSSRYDELISFLFSEDVLDSIYNNDFYFKKLITEPNPMEKSLIELLIPIIGEKLEDEMKVNDTGIFGVKTIYDDDGYNWIYEDSIKQEFAYGARIYAKTLEELKRRVIDKKEIWFVLNYDLEKKSISRDMDIQDEDKLIENQNLRRQAKAYIENTFNSSSSNLSLDVDSNLIKKIHTSEMMEDIVNKTLDLHDILRGYNLTEKVLIRTAVQGMKDALSSARDYNRRTGYFGVVHPRYDNWSYVNLLEREYIGWDDYTVIYGSTLDELEHNVKLKQDNIWCIFDDVKANESQERDRKIKEGLINTESSYDYWSFSDFYSRGRFKSKTIDEIIEKNMEKESFHKMKEEEKINREKGESLDKELNLNSRKMNNDIKKLLR